MVLSWRQWPLGEAVMAWAQVRLWEGDRADTSRGGG